jgi:hypothetical protein
MKCELAHEWIVAGAYGELEDERVHELDRHLEGCPACKGERDQVMALMTLAGALPVAEPDANLVARARLGLDDALDRLGPRSWRERMLGSMRNGLAGLIGSPVAAALVLVIGVGAGSFGGYTLAARRAAATPAAAQTAVAAQQTAPAVEQKSGDVTQVASVSSITRRPNSEIVDVAFNESVPRHVTGSLDDPAIRQLLMMAAESQSSARVRGDSVSLLAEECKIGHSCQAAGIRDALLVALRYDANAAVREKALAGLEPYVEQDVRVRDAVLEAVMNDSDPRIRSASIGLLTPVEGDTTVRQVLHSVSTTDENPHIRFVSQQILNQVPEIQ